MNKHLKIVQKTLKKFLKIIIKKNRHAMVGPNYLWKMKRDFQIHFLKSAGLKPSHYLLDIGCGTLRGGIPLIEYLKKGHYYGIEVRKKALKEGMKELEEANLQIKNPTLLLSEDFSNLEIKHKFEYIWAFSVLIHMNDNILKSTLKFISKHLKDNGAFYANVNIGRERIIGNWKEFPVVKRKFDFYFNTCNKYDLLARDIGALKDFGHISGVESQDSQRILKITTRK